VVRELTRVFSCHGAVEHEVSVMAPKPAQTSKSMLHELRQLHSPALHTSDGHDIRAAAARRVRMLCSMPFDSSKGGSPSLWWRTCER
jgi:hypothetical protein